MKKKYLKFEPEDQYTWQIISLDKNDLLGWIKRVRVGQWMQYCLTYNKDLFTTNDEIYLSASCQDEIRQFCKELKSSEMKGYKQNDNQKNQ